MPGGGVFWRNFAPSSSRSPGLPLPHALSGPLPSQRFPPPNASTLDTPRNCTALQVNFHAPPARPGARPGVPARRGGAGDPDGGDTPPAPPSNTRTDAERPTSAGSESRSAVRGPGLCRTLRTALGRPAPADPLTGRARRLPPSSQPRSPSSRVGPGKKPPGLRAPRSPRPTRRRPPDGGRGPGPTRHPTATYRAEALRGDPARPATPGWPAAPAGGGGGARAWGRGRGAVTSSGGGARARPRPKPLPVSASRLRTARRGGTARELTPPRKSWSAGCLTPRTGSSPLFLSGQVCFRELLFCLEAAKWNGCREVV